MARILILDSDPHMIQCLGFVLVDRYDDQNKPHDVITYLLQKNQADGSTCIAPMDVLKRILKTIPRPDIILVDNSCQSGQWFLNIFQKTGLVYHSFIVATFPQEDQLINYENRATQYTTERRVLKVDGIYRLPKPFNLGYVREYLDSLVTITA